MWFLVGRSQMRCGHRHAVCVLQVWPNLFWPLEWMRNCCVLWPQMTSHISPVLKNSLHHFPTCSLLVENWGVYWLPCHFLPNLRRKAAPCTTQHFSFSPKTFQSLPLHYSEIGVPRNQRIPQNLPFFYANNIISFATLPGPTHIS